MFFVINLFCHNLWMLFGILVLSAFLQIFIYLDMHFFNDNLVCPWSKGSISPVQLYDVVVSISAMVSPVLYRQSWTMCLSCVFIFLQSLKGSQARVKKFFMLYSKSSTSSKHVHYHRMEPQRHMKDVHTLSNPTWHALCATCLPCGYVLLDSVISHVYMHVCVTFCMYAGVRALFQTKPSRLPPHQARQVLLHWNESGDVCICNVVLSSSAWWNLTLLIIVTRPRKEQSSDTFSEVRPGSWGPRYRAATAHFHEDVLIRCLVTFFFRRR